MLTTESSALPDPSTGGDAGGVPAGDQAPSFMFSKHLPSVIERLKTEIHGASFVEKITKQINQKLKQHQPKQEDDQEEQKLDIGDVLQPKKKKARGKGKAKAKAAATPVADDMDDKPDEAPVQMKHADIGSERTRWWVDDMLSSLIHAAGGTLTVIRF